MKKLTLALCTLVVCLLCSCQPKEKEIVIVSVNDMHATIDRFPEFAALVDSLRNVYPNLLVFSGGDNRTGNPVNDQYRPRVNQPIIDLMNEVGFDLSCIGNHEFDANIDNLNYFVESTHFPVICANAEFAKELNTNIKPYVFIENQGVKIGVLGLIQVDASGIPSAHPRNLFNVKFTHAEDMIRNYAFLRNECDVFLVLSHCGYEDDCRLTALMPEADAFIGGHTHTLVREPKEINGVLVTQSGSHLKYATVIKIRVKNHKVISKEAEVIDLIKFGKRNQKIAQMVYDYNNSGALDVVIGSTEKPFSNRQELGCLMSDAIRYELGADIAYQNPGGVRIRKLNAGDITLKNLYELDPFGNEVVKFELTGEQVIEFIKNAIIADKGAGHVSGITYKVNILNNREKNTFDVSYLEVKNEDGTPFDLNKKYIVVMNSYIASVTHFSGEANGEIIPITCSDLTLEYIKKNSPLNYEGIKRVFIERLPDSMNGWD